MSLKLSFNNEIHKIGKAPTTFKALVSAIQESYSNIPKNFSLHYVDPEGDCIMIASDSDLSIFLAEAPKGSIPKIFIISDPEATNLSRETSHEIVDKESITKLLEREPILEVPQAQLVTLAEEKLETKVEAEPLKEELATFESKTSEHTIHNNPYNIAPEISEPIVQSNLRASQYRPESGVHDLISDVVYSAIPEIAMLVKDLIEAEKPKVEAPKVEEIKIKPVEKDLVVHNNIYCDGCGISPIVGVRYQCSVLKNFDLCEDCEAKVDHPYPLLKLRKPKVENFGGCSIFNFFDLARDLNTSTLHYEFLGESKPVEVKKTEEKIEKKEEKPVEKVEVPEKKEVIVEKVEPVPEVIKKVYHKKVEMLFNQVKSMFPELQIQKVDEIYQIDKNITVEDLIDNLL